MSEADSLRAKVAEACRVLGRLDLTRAATGHVSARMPGTDRILVRGRGPEELGVRYTGEAEIVECGLDGRPTAPDTGLTAPLEIFIHTALYRARPDVQAVVHIHPVTPVLFSICNLPLLPLYGAYDPMAAVLAIDGVPTFDRSILIDNPELGDAFARAMGSAPVCIMKGHGITTAGESVEEAAIRAIQLSDLAEINYRARLLGDPDPISPEDQEAIAQAGRQGLKNKRRLEALWRYYVAFTRSEPHSI